MTLDRILDAVQWVVIVYLLVVNVLHSHGMSKMWKNIARLWRSVGDAHDRQAKVLERIVERGGS